MSFGLCIFTSLICTLSSYFSSSAKIRIFQLFTLFDFQQQTKQPRNELQLNCFPDIDPQNREVIHMFQLMSASLRPHRPIKSRPIPYTDPMSVGSGPAEIQISLTLGCGTASEGREHSANGTGPEKTCKRDGGAGFSLLHRGDVFARTCLPNARQGQIKRQSRRDSSLARRPRPLPAYDPRSCA